MVLLNIFNRNFAFIFSKKEHSVFIYRLVDSQLFQYDFKCCQKYLYHEVFEEHLFGGGRHFPRTVPTFADTIMLKAYVIYAWFILYGHIDWPSSGVACLNERICRIKRVKYICTSYVIQIVVYLCFDRNLSWKVFISCRLWLYVHISKISFPCWRTGTES